MTFTRLTTIAGLASVSLLVSSCFITTEATDAASGDIRKVSGSAKVSSNERLADISLVNGSLKMANDSSAKAVSTVNGSIELRDNVRLDSASTVNGSIESGTGLQVADELRTVNGKISLGSNAAIGGDIATVNGDITLDNSQAGGDITTVNGDIRLVGNTVVKGNIVYKPRGKKNSFFSWSSNKATLYISANATVEGNIILEQEVELQIENAAMQDKIIQRFNTDTN